MLKQAREIKKNNRYNLINKYAAWHAIRINLIKGSLFPLHHPTQHKTKKVAF